MTFAAGLLAFASLAPQDPQLPARIDACVQAHMQQDRLPAVSLAIVQQGKELIAKAYGLASIELQVPATPETVFAIASVTKVFTATVVAQLVEQKKLSFDQAVGDLLADLPEAWRKVTVRQLLSHTSGLPDVIVDPVRGTWLGSTRAEAISKAAALPLQFPAGTSWSYNQTNYLLLGAIVEKIAGQPFDDVVRQRIVQPLQLAATTFGDATQIVARRATWYTGIDWDGQQPRRSAELHPASVNYPAFMHTAAALNTTARELAAFAEAVAAGKLVGGALRDAMWTAVALNDGSTFRLEGTLGMGLGWMVDDREHHRAVGGSGGSSVAFRHFVDDKLTVVVLTNLQGHDPDGFVYELAAICVPALAAKR